MKKNVKIKKALSIGLVGAIVAGSAGINPVVVNNPENIDGIVANKDAVGTDNTENIENIENIEKIVASKDAVDTDNTENIENVVAKRDVFDTDNSIKDIESIVAKRDIFDTDNDIKSI